MNELKSILNNMRNHTARLDESLAQWVSLNARLDEILEDVRKSDEAEIPELFTGHEGNECPVPDGVKGNFKCAHGGASRDNVFLMNGYWNDGSLIEGYEIIAYKVTHVPTLRLDDVSHGDKYWIIHQSGRASDLSHDGYTYDYGLIGNKMAYASEELVQCSIDHKCFNSPVYDKMFKD